LSLFCKAFNGLVDKFAMKDTISALIIESWKPEKMFDWKHINDRTNLDAGEYLCACVL
jgi:hypothetical protein